MKIYDLEIQQNIPASFCKKDGIFYHSQDTRNLSRSFWNHDTQSVKTDRSIIFDDISTIPLMMCDPDYIDEFVRAQLPSLIESTRNLDEDGYNIFIVHTDLSINPVYIGFAGMNGVGEQLWSLEEV